MIHQVKPIDNMEKYTLSGNVKNNFYTPDGNLSVNEQIDWYKNALHELEKKEKILNEISISSLGDYIRENILIYKGEITSFQYIQNQSSNEMEFAFTTDSKNFFSIISLLSDKQQLFTITKFSIKTGVADGASVIFRIDVGGSEKGTTEYKGTYIIVAEDVISDPEFPIELSTEWGIKEIIRCADGDVSSSTPGFWISVRMFNHMNQQLMRLKSLKL